VDIDGAVKEYVLLVEKSVPLEHAEVDDGLRHQDPSKPKHLPASTMELCATIPTAKPTILQLVAQ
jgi:hypothetical protein